METPGWWGLKLLGMKGLCGAAGLSCSYNGLCYSYISGCVVDEPVVIIVFAVVDAVTAMSLWDAM